MVKLVSYLYSPHATAVLIFEMLAKLGHVNAEMLQSDIKSWVQHLNTLLPYSMDDIPLESESLKETEDENSLNYSLFAVLTMHGVLHVLPEVNLLRPVEPPEVELTSKSEFM